MRRLALLAAALAPLWSGAALACTPSYPPAQQEAARQQLARLNPQTVACPFAAPARTEQTCTVYAAPPQQVQPLLSVLRFIQEPGEQSRLLPHPGGSLEVIRRHVTARAKLSGELSAVMRQLASWTPPHRWQFWARPTCAELGLRGNAWYKVQSCRVRWATRDIPEIHITLTQVTDASLPAGQPLRFGRSSNTCLWYDFKENP